MLICLLRSARYKCHINLAGKEVRNILGTWNQGIHVGWRNLKLNLVQHPLFFFFLADEGTEIKAYAILLL